MFYYVLQGINLIQELINEYGLDVVQAYMNHIQVTANSHVLTNGRCMGFFPFKNAIHKQIHVMHILVWFDSFYVRVSTITDI